MTCYGLQWHFTFKAHQPMAANTLVSRGTYARTRISFINDGQFVNLGTKLISKPVSGSLVLQFHNYIASNIALWIFLDSHLTIRRSIIPVWHIRVHGICPMQFAVRIAILKQVTYLLKCTQCDQRKCAGIWREPGWRSRSLVSKVPSRAATDEGEMCIVSVKTRKENQKHLLSVWLLMMWNNIS